MFRGDVSEASNRLNIRKAFTVFEYNMTSEAVRLYFGSIAFLLMARVKKMIANQVFDRPGI